MSARSFCFVIFLSYLFWPSCKRARSFRHFRASRSYHFIQILGNPSHRVCIFPFPSFAKMLFTFLILSRNIAQSKEFNILYIFFISQNFCLHGIKDHYLIFSYANTILQKHFKNGIFHMTDNLVEINGSSSFRMLVVIILGMGR